MRAPHRRTLLGLTAAVGVTALLVGCGGGGGGGKAADPGSTERPEEVDFTVGVWGDATRADLYQEALDMFTADQEGVTATMEFADRGPFFERLTTAAASKKLPDVFWLTDTYFGRYASAGALLDLTPYLGDQIDTTEIADTWLPYGEVDGKSFGVPSHYNGQAVVIDQRIFDAADAEYDAKTWDDMFDIARKLTRPADGVWGLEDNTLGVTQRGFEVWARQHDQELFDDKGQLGFDKDLVIDWWNMWDELRKEGVIPPPDVQIESEAQGVTTGLLTHGQVAIRLSSATHLSAYSAPRDGGLSIHDYPEIKGAAKDWRMYTALMLVAAANTDAPGVAAELIGYLVNNEKAAAVTQISMGTPSPATVAESILPLLSDVDQEVVTYLTDQQTNPSRPSPLLPETSEQFTAALARFSQEIAYGRMTPKDAADALFEDAKRYLD